MGDFFELWKYKLPKIVKKRKSILDKLAKLNTTYVPGNHDIQVTETGKNKPSNLHDFFNCVSPVFIKTFGEKKFKFMHGHEVDPFIPSFLLNCGKMFGTIACAFEITSQGCILSNDAVSDLCLEVGEKILSVSHSLASCIGLAFRECYPYIPAEQFNKMQRSIRTEKMLIRYHKDMSIGLYDRAIVAHTHKAGFFDNWYYNSGSWTGQTNNFLKIFPNGNIDVLDWTKNGPQKNNTSIAC